jgi:hypothetical protein
MAQEILMGSKLRTHKSEERQRIKDAEPKVIIKEVKVERKLIDMSDPTNRQLDAHKRLELFTAAYINNKGKHVEAYIEAGFSENSAKSLAKPYLNRHYDYVMTRFKRDLGLRNTQYISLIEEIASSKDERTADRLKALDMLAKLGGLTNTDITIKHAEATDLSPHERQRLIDEYLATKTG